jgi:hypothetical protein
MAITRAQQFRQMLKDGNVAMQGGVKNYLGEQETVSNVPIKWKSGPNKPATELAYITEAEKKLLLKEDIHGSLKDGPNKGPEGIMSLDSAGDKDGPVGGFSGEDVSAAERGERVAGMTDAQARGFRAGAIAAGAGIKGTDDLKTLAEANKISKGVRDRYAKQKNLTFVEKMNLYNIGTKQKAIDRYINQRKNKIAAGLELLNINPAYDDPTETFDDLIDQAPSITGMTDLYSQKTIDDVLAGNRQIDFFTPVEGFSTFGTLANIVGPKMGGPVTKEKLQSLSKEIGLLQGIDPSKTSTKELMKEFAPNQYKASYPDEFRQEGDGGAQPFIPITQASAPVEEEDYYASVGGNPFENRQAYRLFNKGGIADTVVGGEYDFESARQMYGLGKLVKKVTRTVKKIAKSPVGKAAILGAVGFGIPGTSFGGLLGRASFGGAAKGLFGTYGPASALRSLGLMKTQVGPNLFERVGPLSKLGPMSGIFAASALAGLMTPKPDDEDEDEDTYRGEGIDIAAIRADPFSYTPRRFAAEGGDIEKEPVAKKTMPLLDMGGKEMDLRAEGGFVPIGRMEKADDVPARLSKNEFVFTADAVRNAGDGDVDKGAEVMYNMMKNLESGGDVSEESQGLKGAREMFQTSQRLGEVI